MPKKILDAFFGSMIRDIKNHYQSGDKFLSIREIAEQYKVSVQTAQRGVKRLEEYGYISVKQKAGITVETLRPTKKLAGYKIAVVSARPDARFNDVKFSEYLLSLDADGIIALYCRDSILPFYHVLREGLDIVKIGLYCIFRRHYERNHEGGVSPRQQYGNS
ncbi:hypothetical protein FACS189479_04790 [Spirochaetia bacterium]|nr:hypothetical protein FACS189479_04790 [Spirochaetia bacterium]